MQSGWIPRVFFFFFTFKWVIQNTQWHCMTYDLVVNTKAGYRGIHTLNHLLATNHQQQSHPQ